MTERERYADIPGQRRSDTAEARAAFAKIWRDIWGDDLAYELAPTNFITWDDLRRIATELRLDVGSRLLDVGCGRGGPGLWIAERTGASVVGIDFSPEACATASQQATEKFAGVTATYRVADMTATGLPAAFADAAVSIDVVQIAPQRLDAFREVARMLRPTARFVVTTWDHPGEMTPGSLMPGREIVPDSRPLLEQAGFRVLAYDRLSSWDIRAEPTYRALLAQRDAVATVAGEAMVREAEWGAVHAHSSVHVYIACELP